MTATRRKDNDQFTNAVGMTTLQIAEALRAKYYKLLDQQPRTPWKELPAGERSKWDMAVETIATRWEEGVKSISARGAATEMVSQIKGPGVFEKLPPLLQLVWEAVLRHAVNLVTIGQPAPGDRITPREIRQEFDAEMAFDWSQWIVEQAEKRNVKRKSNV